MIIVNGETVDITVKGTNAVTVSGNTVNIEVTGARGATGDTGPIWQPEYSIYAALITQQGLNVPVATILENTLGTLSFAYVSDGVYSVSSSSLFTLNKTAVLFGGSFNIAYSGVPAVYGADIINTSTIYIYSGDASLQSVDNNLFKRTLIEIRVYN